MDKQAFQQEAQKALACVRDIVRLQRMALCDVCVPQAPRAERGWHLARYLLQVIESLRPMGGKGADWVSQRYNILTLRYVNGMSPDEVADHLGISRRHFYRQLQLALDEYTDLLWSQVSPEASAQGKGAAADAHDERAHMQLLRQEYDRVADAREAASLAEVLESVLRVLEPILRTRPERLRCDVPQSLPDLALGAEILKQLLLALLGEMLRMEGCERITLSACSEDRGVVLTLTQEGERLGESIPVQGEPAFLTNASMLLAKLQGVHWRYERPAADEAVYALSFPVAERRVVLVVDDNEDVCQLFQRYLLSGGYQASVATNAADAIRLAESLRPFAVTLDLMMSQTDGWDVLHKLTQEPSTARLPIIVCSVLDQEALALTLGAKGFIKKPVLREALLKVLASLAPEPPTPESS